MVKKDRFNSEAVSRQHFFVSLTIFLPPDSACRLELMFGVLARDAFEQHAPAGQEFHDAEGAFSAFTARHNLGAEGDEHAGARPTVGLRIAAITVASFFRH